jgi:parvulin-like peptidyl-prolyl isomerase
METLMADLMKIDDELITSDRFVNLLKLTGRFDAIFDEVVKERVIVHSARRDGITITPEAVQERADQLRRVNGLHRAVEMKRYLENMKVSVTEYQEFITDLLYYEKMMERVLSDASVEKFFNLNSPKFDSIDVNHIVLDSEGKAREIMAILEDEPERFAELAREHSFADTGKEGGYIGRVSRGSLQADVESKVFHAEEGSILGPFPTPDGLFHEIFLVNRKRAPTLDEDTKTEIRRILKDKWLSEQEGEHRLEVL